MDDETLRFLIASLIDHFHLTPSQIGQLTRVQLHSLYLYPRDKHGTLKPPIEAPSVPAKAMDRKQFVDALKAHFASLGQALKGYEAWDAK